MLPRAREQNRFYICEAIARVRHPLMKNSFFKLKQFHFLYEIYQKYLFPEMTKRTRYEELFRLYLTMIVCPLEAIYQQNIIYFCL
ncbi:MAG: hypothetical protein DRG11_01985 [Epsilonproteobacteria bacterium]|nr:MAG: hypothetical protein DRG11_01985 [Campylobacterota bacterium]